MAWSKRPSELWQCVLIRYLDKCTDTPTSVHSCSDDSTFEQVTSLIQITLKPNHWTEKCALSYHLHCSVTVFLFRLIYGIPILYQNMFVKLSSLLRKLCIRPSVLMALWKIAFGSTEQTHSNIHNFIKRKWIITISQWLCFTWLDGLLYNVLVQYYCFLFLFYL